VEPLLKNMDLTADSSQYLNHSFLSLLFKFLARSIKRSSIPLHRTFESISRVSLGQEAGPRLYEVLDWLKSAYFLLPSPNV
jgi:hypothetical protein